MVRHSRKWLWLALLLSWIAADGARGQALELNFPKAGVDLQPGATAVITWSGFVTTPIRLEYSTDAGWSWQLIADSITGSSYSWTVPNTPSCTCLARAMIDVGCQGPTLDTTITVQANVDSSNPLSNTSIFVGKGQLITFHNSGEWAWGLGKLVSPDVGQPGRPDPTELPVIMMTPPPPQFFGVLVAKVGDGNYFAAKSGTEDTSDACGFLKILMNDRIGYYNDNSGSINSHITISNLNGTVTFDTALSDGEWTIGNPVPANLSFSTSDESTDTIGATVSVPITINGLVRPENVDLILHYDGAIDYIGSFSPSGAKLDVAGDSRPGLSVLSITGATSGVVLGNAKFNVFSDSGEDAHATFDLVSVLTAISPCEYSLPEAVTSTITAPSGCGISILSQLIHLGIVPTFSVKPNPASGSVWISSTADLGDVTIAVYDMLGVERSEIVASVSKDNPVELLLPQADGVYNIVAKYLSGMSAIRVVQRHQ